MVACTVPPVATVPTTPVSQIAGSTTSTAPVATTSTTTPCGLGPVPNVVDELVVEIDIDFDGDTAPDQVSAYFVKRVWHLRVELTSGGGGDLNVSGRDVRPLGGHDIDGDGRREVFAVVGSVDGFKQIGVYGASNCGVVEIAIGANPVRLEVGRTENAVKAVTCNPGLASLSVGSTDDGLVLRRTNYRLVANQLVPADQEPVAISEEEAQALAIVDCPGVSQP